MEEQLDMESMIDEMYSKSIRRERYELIGLKRRQRV